MHFTTVKPLFSIQQIFQVSKFLDFYGMYYMRLVMRKPVFGISDQVWLKPACSAAKTS